ncbi:hypothetical protein CC77DRAFT_536502 [Alternaria alternata]|uniref:Uncharacterized protein n=1 Tax=Alternaria alternata TaxID=5599 RepID=A0A177DY22_ALTAL|nr:hypothetical protein CC77DRAFT_536502 [Alternaria alternata]OAG24614.1 hypothetical protein CC77DRAFT_536502 [Alternaria alternata]
MLTMLRGYTHLYSTYHLWLYSRLSILRQTTTCVCRAHPRTRCAYTQYPTTGQHPRRSRHDRISVGATSFYLEDCSRTLTATSETRLHRLRRSQISVAVGDINAHWIAPFSTSKLYTR